MTGKLKLKKWDSAAHIETDRAGLRRVGPRQGKVRRRREPRVARAFGEFLGEVVALWPGYRGQFPAFVPSSHGTQGKRSFGEGPGLTFNVKRYIFPA